MGWTSVGTRTRIGNGRGRATNEGSVTRSDGTGLVGMGSSCGCLVGAARTMFGDQGGAHKPRHSTYDKICSVVRSAGLRQQQARKSDKRERPLQIIGLIVYNSRVYHIKRAKDVGFSTFNSGIATPLRLRIRLGFTFAVTLCQP